MTEAERVYYSEIKERKRTGYGASNKKRQGGKTIRMPSDHLSRKEWKKMNGDIKSYDLGKPMKWEEFKALPVDLAQKYMNMLKENYRLPLVELAKLLGVTSNTVYVYCKKNKIKPCWDRGGDTKRVENFYKSSAWIQFEKWKNGEILLNGNDVTEVSEEPVETVVEEPVAEVYDTKPNETFVPDNTNTISPEEVLTPKFVLHDNDVIQANVDVAKAQVEDMTITALIGMLKGLGVSAEINISIKV